MFVLMVWILIIECVTVEIKVVYGTDRVIITIPVHGEKTGQHARTVYMVVEKPVSADLRTNRRPQTTAPDVSRPLGWYGGGGETAQDAADVDRHEARRQLRPSHGGVESRGHGAGPFAGRAGPHAAGGHWPNRVVHVVGRHKHGHYATVMYVGQHRPRRLRGPPRHAYPTRLKPAFRPGAGGDRARKPPRRGAQAVGFRPAAPVVVPPPPPSRRPHEQDDGYRVQENAADQDDGRHTARDPLPYITVAGPAEAAQQHAPAAGAQQAALVPQQTAVGHVYYTLDPVVPYDDVTRRPSE